MPPNGKVERFIFLAMVLSFSNNSLSSIETSSAYISKSVISTTPLAANYAAVIDEMKRASLYR